MSDVDVFADTPGAKEFDSTSAGINPSAFPQGFMQSFNIQRKNEFDNNQLTGQISRLYDAVQQTVDAASNYGVDLKTPENPLSKIKETAEQAFFSGDPLLSKGLDFWNQINHLKNKEETIQALELQHPQDTNLRAWSQIIQTLGQQSDNERAAAQQNSDNQTTGGEVGGIAGSIAGFMLDPLNAAMTVAAIATGGTSEIAEEALQQAGKSALEKAYLTSLRAATENAVMQGVTAPGRYKLDELFANKDLKLPDFVTQQAEQALSGGLIAGGVHLAGLGMVKAGSALYRRFFAKGRLNKVTSQISDALKVSDDIHTAAISNPNLVSPGAFQEGLDPMLHLKAYSKAFSDVYNGKAVDLSDILPNTPKPPEPNPIEFNDEMPFNNPALDKDTTDRIINAARKFLDDNPDFEGHTVDVPHIDEQGNEGTTPIPIRDFLKNHQDEVESLETTLKCMRGS